MSTRACHIDGCPGTEIEEETEYGSYEVFRCDTCGNVCRSQLPD